MIPLIRTFLLVLTLTLTPSQTLADPIEEIEDIDPEKVVRDAIQDLVQDLKCVPQERWILGVIAKRIASAGGQNPQTQRS